MSSYALQIFFCFLLGLSLLLHGGQHLQNFWTKWEFIKEIFKEKRKDTGFRPRKKERKQDLDLEKRKEIRFGPRKKKERKHHID